MLLNPFHLHNELQDSSLHGNALTAKLATKHTQADQQKYGQTNIEGGQ